MKQNLACQMKKTKQREQRHRWTSAQGVQGRTQMTLAGPRHQVQALEGQMGGAGPTRPTSLSRGSLWNLGDMSRTRSSTRAGLGTAQARQQGAAVGRKQKA